MASELGSDREGFLFFNCEAGVEAFRAGSPPEGRDRSGACSTVSRCVEAIQRGCRTSSAYAATRFHEEAQS